MKIIDPIQEWLDSLPRPERVKRHVEKLRMLRARVSVMEERGVAAMPDDSGIFTLYKSDALKQIAVIEEELKAELRGRFGELAGVLERGERRAA